MEQIFRLIALFPKEPGASIYSDSFLGPWLEKYKSEIRIINVCQDYESLEAFIPIPMLSELEVKSCIGSCSSSPNFREQFERLRLQNNSVVSRISLAQFGAELTVALGADGRRRVSSSLDQDAGRIDIKIVADGSVEAGSILGVINSAFVNSWTGRWPTCQVEMIGDSLKLDFFYLEKFWMTGSLVATPVCLALGSDAAVVMIHRICRE